MQLLRFGLGASGISSPPYFAGLYCDEIQKMVGKPPQYFAFTAILLPKVLVLPKLVVYAQLGAADLALAVEAETHGGLGVGEW